MSILDEPRVNGYHKEIYEEMGMYYFEHISRGDTLYGWKSGNWLVMKR